MELDKMKIVLTTTDNQKNNNNKNMTSIDLGDCEKLLRDFYNITDEKIYLEKIDIIQDKMRIPKIEYRVYGKLNGSNLVKLELSICQDSKIFIIVPVEILESLDKLNTNSNYFNNICYTATSANGTDTPLKDRQKEFVEQNKTICQDDCVLYDYNYTTKKANCSCKPKESSFSFSEMHINKTKLFNNFINIKNIANVNILICYKTLLTKDNLIYNIGSYIVLIIMIFHIISIIIFYSKQYKLLKLIIKDLVFAINKVDLINNKNQIKDTNRKKNQRINANKKNKTKNNTKSTINALKTNERNNNSIQLKENRNINQINKKNKPMRNFFDFFSNNIAKRNINNKNNINNKKDKKQIILKNNIASLNLQRKQIGRNNINNNRLKTNTNNKRSNNNEKIKERVKKIFDYIEQEKNTLEYNIALKQDKRNYCEYYQSLLKTQHELIFSFFQSNDYNAKIIKIDLFFISFVIYYTNNKWPFFR